MPTPIRNADSVWSCIMRLVDFAAISFDQMLELCLCSFLWFKGLSHDVCILISKNLVVCLDICTYKNSNLRKL